MFQVLAGVSGSSADANIRGKDPKFFAGLTAGGYLVGQCVAHMCNEMTSWMCSVLTFCSMNSHTLASSLEGCQGSESPTKPRDSG